MLPQRSLLSVILQITGFILWGAFALISMIFLMLGYIALRDKPPKDIDQFCEDQCDPSAGNFSGCMDSCFQALGGAEGLRILFFVFGFLGVVFFITICLKIVQIIKHNNRSKQ